MVKKLRVFIVGYNGFGNVGDDAILTALVKSLDEQLRVSATLYIYMQNRYVIDNFCNVKKIQAIGIRSPLAILKSFVKSSLILICGGDHLHDFGSKLKRLKVFAFFLVLGILAKLSFKRLILVNNGVRVRTRWGAGLIRAFLKLVTRASFRDTPSYILAKKLGLRHVTLGFDTGVLLDGYFELKTKVSCNIDGSSLTKVGISITPVYRNFFSKPALDNALADGVAFGINQMLREFKNVRIYLLCFNNDPYTGDMAIIENVLCKLSFDFVDRVEVLEYKGLLVDFLSAFSDLDVIVGCKYHSLLFSYVFDKPLVVINYHPKNMAFAYEVKLKSNSLVSLEDVKKGVLAEKIQELLLNPHMFKANYPIQKAKKRALAGIGRCIA